MDCLYPLAALSNSPAPSVRIVTLDIRAHAAHYSMHRSGVFLGVVIPGLCANLWCDANMVCLICLAPNVARNAAFTLSTRVVLRSLGAHLWGHAHVIARTRLSPHKALDALAREDRPFPARTIDDVANCLASALIELAVVIDIAASLRSVCLALSTMRDAFLASSIDTKCGRDAGRHNRGVGIVAAMIRA